VSSNAKNTKPHTAIPQAPNRYTTRRPTRSDSAPHRGIVTKCTAEPISTAFSPSRSSVSRIGAAIPTVA
jgi:hypothetical protein